MLPIPIPFQNEIDDLFKSDRSILQKIGGGVFIGAVAATGVTLQDPQFANEPGLVAAVLVALSALGAFSVLLLSLKDVVRKRTQEGRPVSFLLRLYLVHGMISVALGVATIILFTFIGCVLWFALTGP